MKESVSLRPGACCWLTEKLGGGHRTRMLVYPAVGDQIDDMRQEVEA